MAKAVIRELKARRFWRWLCVEIYSKPEPRDPIKMNRHIPRSLRWNKRKAERCLQAAWRMIEARSRLAVKNGGPDAKA